MNYPAWDHYEQQYLAEKLNSWLTVDIRRLSNALEEYLMTGNPKCIEYLNDQLAWLSDPQSSMQRELAYIESRRTKEEQVA